MAWWAKKKQGGGIKLFKKKNPTNALDFKLVTAKESWQAERFV